MNTDPNGGSAFPAGTHNGMTLRDVFAGQAMSGWVASFPTLAQAPVTKANADNVANVAYAIADAMLAARKAKR